METSSTGARSNVTVRRNSDLQFTKACYTAVHLDKMLRGPRGSHHI